MEVLKKKMRQAKEDTERLKDENEELSRKLHMEILRREAVSVKAREEEEFNGWQPMLFLFLAPDIVSRHSQSSFSPPFINNLPLVIVFIVGR